MKKSRIIDFVERAILAVLCLVSVALILSGFIYGAGWSAFGVVLLAPLIISTVCYVYRPIDEDSEPAKSASAPAKAA